MLLNLGNLTANCSLGPPTSYAGYSFTSCQPEPTISCASTQYCDNITTFTCVSCASGQVQTSDGFGCNPACSTSSTSLPGFVCQEGEWIAGNLTLSQPVQVDVPVVVQGNLNVSSSLTIVKGGQVDVAQNLNINGGSALIVVQSLNSSIFVIGNLSFANGSSLTVATGTDSVGIPPIVIDGCALIDGDLVLDLFNETIMPGSNSIILMNYGCHEGQYSSLRILNSNASLCIEKQSLQYLSSQAVVLLEIVDGRCHVSSSCCVVSKPLLLVVSIPFSLALVEVIFVFVRCDELGL